MFTSTCAVNRVPLDMPLAFLVFWAPNRIWGNLASSMYSRINGERSYMTTPYSRPEIPIGLDLHVEQNELRWTVTEIGDVTQDAEWRSTSGKIIGSGSTPLKRRTVTWEGVSGVEGEVLPRGRLPALMKGVGKPEHMYALCWAVLRRYIFHKKRLPNPPRQIRQQAYESIKRAWNRANVDNWLRKLPATFWSEHVPTSEGAIWPMYETLDLRLFDLIILIDLGQPLEVLLHPEFKPFAAGGSAAARIAAIDRDREYG